jgi:hypothetical protein
MASVVAQASAAATSVAIPTHQVGDLIVVSARGTVAPSVPAAGGTVPAWTTIQSSAQFSIALTVVAFVATATNHTTGTFTNATHIGVLVLRPAAGKKLGFGASSVGGANNATTLIYPALTLQAVDGTSLGVRIGTRVTASTQLASNMPASWTKQIEQPVTTAAMVVSTRLALAANPTADTVTAGASNAAYRGVTFEVRELTPATLFGTTSLDVTFGQAIQAQRETFGQLTALPITFDSFVDGVGSTSVLTQYGSTSSSWVFDAVTAGQRETFGKTALSINASIVTAGVRLAKTLYGIVAMPIVFTKDVKGVRKAFGQIVAPFIFSKDVRGQRKTFGQIASPFIFSKDVRAQRKTFGQTEFPITFSSTTSGFRPGIRQYGVVALPIIFGKDVKGQKRALGQIAMPIVFAKDVRGIRRVSGQVAMSIIFTKDVKAKRKTFSQISAPFIFGAVTQGRKRTFSKVAFPIGFNIDVKTGRVGTHGRIAFPIVVGLTTSGNLKLVGVVLNQAEMVYLGIEPVKAVYAGVEKVWPIFSPAKLSGLVIWFDAVDYTPSSWPNKGSGSAVNIVGSPAMTIGPTKNGLPVVRFKPNEGRVRMNGTGIDLNYTCVYVGRMWGLSSGGRIVTAQYPPSNLLIGYWNFNEDVCYVEGFLMPDARKPQTTNWHMYSLDGESLLPVTHEDYKPRFFSNGVFLSGDHGSTGGWKDTFSINGYAPTTIEETCECEIAEVVLYNRKLSDVDRQQVEAYLRDKWGI